MGAFLTDSLQAPSVTQNVLKVKAAALQIPCLAIPGMLLLAAPQMHHRFLHQILSQWWRHQ